MSIFNYSNYYTIYNITTCVIHTRTAVSVFIYNYRHGHIMFHLLISILINIDDEDEHTVESCDIAN